MIVGLILRNIKTYQGINYIPLSAGDSFCGLVGDNGIGKSSVLEALDSFFNDREWNLNIVTRKSGTTTTKPYIIPVFLLPKTYFDRSQIDMELLNKLSDSMWNVVDEDLNPANRKKAPLFYEQRDQLNKITSFKDSLLLPVGVDHSNKVTLGIFNCKSLGEKIFEDEFDSSQQTINEEFLEGFREAYDFIKSKTDYIYIPREIDPELFTKLETKEIQVLMGESLTKIVEDRVKPSQIKEINNKLNEFIDQISKELVDYSYRTPTERQKNIRKNDIYNVIIESFFNIRKLHKKQGASWLEIGNLSSGEKQKAIIHVAHNLLEKHRDGTADLIMAVDEPESSLHMSACFDQFLSLYEISRTCSQLLFSSHWYGFFPTIEKGFVSVITEKKSEHKFDLINLEVYRQSIKQQGKETKGKLPFDIRLKSINDFVQSVITSILSDDPFNWIICEGSSEKIYFTKYFENEIKDKRLRVVPVGGAAEVKRIYNQLSAAYEDFKKYSKGKVYLLIDTDEELVDFETKQYDNVSCKRMVNIDKTLSTKLVNPSQNPKSPKTEIEDVLNGKLFIETLKTFQADCSESLDFIDFDADHDEVPSYYALNMRPTDHKKIMAFFDKDDNKINFANRYVELLEKGTYKTPDWIEEIREFFE
ncbi:MAG: ATP-binding protein [Oceanobacter sp.]